jgi:hypothetical protein
VARRLWPASFVVGLLAVLLPSPATAAAPIAPIGPAGAIQLAAQTPVVEAGGTFVMQLRFEGVPADAVISLVLHQRVRSRSELALSRSGDGLRNATFDTAAPLDSLAEQADGTRRLALSLDPAAGGVQLQTEGVYPVEVIAQSTDDTELARLVTHMIMAPEAGDDAPPLGVAVVAEVDAPPAFQPDGTVILERSDVEAVAAIVAGLAAAREVPLTVAARPETIEALASSPEPGDAELVEALRGALTGRTVLPATYADVSPDDLGPAGLLDEINAQLARGREVLVDALGVSPTGTVAIAPPDLGRTGLATLTFTGVRRVVVEADQVEPLDPAIISYSLAQPFLLAPAEDTTAGTDLPDPLQAMATDPTVMEHLAASESDGSVASRVLSELAFIRLEQPSVARSMVLPLGDGVSAGVVQLVLGGLAEGRPFAPMGLDAAFDHAVPLLDGGDNPVDRALAPVTSTPIRSLEAERLQAARPQLDTFGGLVGGESPLTEPLERHLLLAAASGLTASERRAHIEAVETAIAAVTGAVSTPETFTLTLAARDGTIPLTIHNDSGHPLHVTVRLRSRKLEFPDGDTIDRVLTEDTTRIDIPVRARASGAFPLEVDVTTPDGRQSLSMTRYTVRSTAISGVGLVISVGAGVFLTVWWARHWRRTRRSAKLVAAHSHPAAG